MPRPDLSRAQGGLRIGADFFERRGLLAPPGGPTPRGVVDRVSDLANPKLDPTRVHPAVARFLEDTSGLELSVVSAWRGPVGLGWRLVRWFFQAIGQFALPVRVARIRTRVRALDPDQDGRAGIAPREVVRTYADSGAVMQAVAYGTYAEGDTRFMSAAFPMPFGQVAGILRLDPIVADEDGLLAARLTATPDDGDAAGVYFVLGPLVFRAPLGEDLALYPPHLAPPELREAFPDAILLGRHEQRLFGVRFVTHAYGFHQSRKG